MTIKVAIDVSGLAWRYRTGVQNLYWAFINAWFKNPSVREHFDISFYDRSGAFNSQIADIAGGAYESCAPAWWPHGLRRLLQTLIRGRIISGSELSGVVNHVWNWNIYQPPGASASITIPDVLPLEFPQWFDGKFRRITSQSLRFASDQAEFIFAISKFVKQRIVETTSISPERIHVVYPGIDLQYFSNPETILIDSTLQKHGLIRGQYLLSSGFLDPRKNLARQLKAFSIYVQRRRSDLRYALTGLKTTLSGDVLELIESPELRSRVVFLGYIPPSELKILMAASSALMYCSIAEGFGLPIIEAMALGAPVITSATSSMKELAETRARLVDPLEPEDIAAAIDETLGCSAEDRIMRIRGNQAYARDFTIDSWLSGHLDAYASKTTQVKAPNP